MDPLNTALNEIKILERRVAELQAGLDRQAQLVHDLKHDKRAVVEGCAARVEFALSRLAHSQQLMGELHDSLLKESIGG